MTSKKVGLNREIPPGGSFQHVPTGADAPKPGGFVPQQTPIPGMPLPIGTPVMLDKKSLTPKEKQDLEAIGWKEGQPIPSNLAELIDKVKQEAFDPAFMPPPGDPATPPLQMPKEVSLSDLPEAKKKELQQILEQTAAMKKEQETARATTPVQPGEGVMEAIKAAQGQGGKEIQLDNDLPKAEEKKPEPAAVEEPQEEPEQAQEEESAPKKRHYCPNCSWDISREDVVEVEEEDKVKFLAAILGNRPFEKTYDCFGGKMEVTFRMLRPNEVDACFKQAWRERQSDQLLTEADLLEQINRYRMCLQLVKLRIGENMMDFPESLNAWNTEGVDDASTLLPRIEKIIFEESVGSESTLRIMQKEVMKFSRLATRMEANVENENFWKAAGSRQ